MTERAKTTKIQCSLKCDGHGPLRDGSNGWLICNDCFPEGSEVPPTETYDDHFIICPFCGHKHRDPYEFFSGSSECTEVECYGCERTFAVTKMVSITYHATPLKEAHGRTV